MSLDVRWLEEAEGYLELDLPDQALESLARVTPTGRSEHSFVFEYQMGEILRRQERYEQAIPHFRRALAERPAEISCAINLAWCFKRNDQLDQAIETLLQAERRCQQGSDGESLPLVYYNLSCYYSLADQRERMLAYLRLALELEERYRDSIPDETDFDRFRDDPDFIRLTSVIV